MKKRGGDLSAVSNPGGEKDIRLGVESCTESGGRKSVKGGIPHSPFQV